MSGAPLDVTQLLLAWGDGREEALDELLPLVYPELQRLARAYLRREPRDALLQTDALINDAFLRLVDQRRVQWASRAHFFGICARLMRRILVDQARQRAAAKRGGGARLMTLNEDVAGGDDRNVELLLLDDALTKLAELDERQARIVELRFFAGLTIEETADFLDIGAATVKREWVTAKAWLRRRMRSESS